MELSIWPSLWADLHSKDEAVLKVAQRVQDSPRRAGMAELADAADSKAEAISFKYKSINKISARQQTQRIFMA